MTLGEGAHRKVFLRRRPLQTFFFLGKIATFPGHSLIPKHDGLFLLVIPLILLNFSRRLLFFIMPISNGDAMTNTATDALDYTKALEILQKEYPERDGIDVKTLIDSKRNGGLTYNDFLMLPGYIGTLPLSLPDFQSFEMRHRHGCTRCDRNEHGRPAL